MFCLKKHGYARKKKVQNAGYWRWIYDGDYSGLIHESRSYILQLDESNYAVCKSRLNCNTIILNQVFASGKCPFKITMIHVLKIRFSFFIIHT